MIGFYDYAVIAFYFLFMLAIGVVCRRFSHNISDYFRGGGSMQWWMVGTSGFMGMISAWTFTGAAGKCYQTGLLVPMIYFMYALISILIFLFLARRFRQLRVITHVEAIRLRYGKFTEQFYTWTSVPLALIYGCLMLNAVAVFTASVFNINLEATLIVLGVVVLIGAEMGGAWAVATSDFLHMLVVMTITIVAAFLCLRQPEVGGLAGLFDKLPPAHFHWTQLARGEIIAFWLLANFVHNFIVLGNLSGGAPYLTAKDGSHARKASLVFVVGYILAPMVWFIPPLAATIMFPNISETFSQLRYPEEAAYIAVCLKILPKGLVGLLLCGIFAVAMSPIAIGINRTAGILVRNFYQPVLRPQSSQTHLVFVSKFVTCLLGVILIIMALYLNKLRTLGLFDIMLMIGALWSIPLAIPQLLAILTRRGSGWSAWSTALIGLIVSALLYHAKDRINDYIPKLMGWSTALSPREGTDMYFALAIVVVVIVCTLWYFLTSLFDSRAPLAYRQQVDKFFRDMHTPIDPVKENVVDTDERQFRVLGLMAIVYAAFILLCALIPNSLLGRLCFLFCGGIFLLVGGLLYRVSKKYTRHPAASHTHTDS